jgi:RNA recognition motif-containing protein
MRGWKVFDSLWHFYVLVDAEDDVKPIKKKSKKPLDDKEGDDVKNIKKRIRKPLGDEEEDDVKPIKKKIKKPIDDEEDGFKKPIKKKKTKRELEEEEIKLVRTIFVGNLPTTVKKKHLIREFSQFGQVDTARLRSVALVDVRLFFKDTPPALAHFLPSLSIFILFTLQFLRHRILRVPTD